MFFRNSTVQVVLEVKEWVECLAVCPVVWVVALAVLLLAPVATTVPLLKRLTKRHVAALTCDSAPTLRWRWRCLLGVEIPLVDA
jgi:hypothetical protein